MSNLATESLQRAGCFLTSEANKTRSRSTGLLASGQSLLAGALLGLIATASPGASAVKASGANTGNGVMGAITVGAGAKVGIYRLRVVTAATNAGDFEVIDPDGDVAGIGHVAAAFTGGGLSFTLADGATDFIVGDGFDITVSAGAATYTALDLAGTHGQDVCAGILFDTTDATSAAEPCVVIDSDVEVRESQLIYPGGFTSAQKATAKSQLAARGIKFSPTY